MKFKVGSLVFHTSQSPLTAETKPFRVDAVYESFEPGRNATYLLRFRSITVLAYEDELTAFATTKVRKPKRRDYTGEYSALSDAIMNKEVVNEE